MNTQKISVCGAVVLSLFARSLFAQAGNDNATGAAGWLNGQVTTGCSYDPYTGNAKRSVTDIVVAGAVGAYPLAFTRVSNSRYNVGAGAFGDLGEAGNWSHSYQWTIDSQIRSQKNGYPNTFAVNYPDGRRVIFSNNTVNNPNNDPYLRSGPGVMERFKVSWDSSTAGRCYLLLPDGGQVWFNITITPSDYKGKLDYGFAVQGIIDPYGLTTTIVPQSDWSTLVTEPAGRWIRIFFRTIVAGGRQAPNVIDHINASDGRSVQYIYSSFTTPPDGYAYTALTSVIYYNDSNLIATYTYQNNNQLRNGTPLLRTCNDPMYAGPMHKIAYTFATGKNPDGTAVVSGQILSENYFDGSNVHGAAVSTLSMPTSATRTETRADGKTRTFTYASALLTSWTDFKSTNRSTASQVYNRTGYVRWITDFNGTDGSGHTTNFTRDPFTRNINQITYPATPGDAPAGGGIVKYGWVAPCSGTNSDPNNCDSNNAYYLYSATDEAGNQTLFFRDNPDGSKRVSRIQYPDGGSESFQYNSFGEVTSHTMTTGWIETFKYDSRGLLQAYRDPYHATGNPTAWYQYDSLDRISGVTDSLGSHSGDINHTTNYTYNSRGQVLVTTHPVDPGPSNGGSTDGQAGKQYTISNVYKPTDGTLSSVTDEELHTTSFTYDDYRRLRTVTTPGHNTPLTANWYYDSSGTGDDYTHTGSRVTHVTSLGGEKITATYDENWRKISVTVGYGTPDAATTSYGYDRNGNVTSVVAPNEQPGQTYANQSIVAAAYDQRNRPMSVTDALNDTATFNYDAFGREARITRPNGQITTFDSYDAMNRLLQQTVQQSPDPDAVTKYTYYTSGLLHTMQDPHLVANNSGYSYTYSYDQMGRKTGLRYPPDSNNNQTTESWHYDQAGRVDTFTNRAGNIETHTYDALNRLTNSSWNDGGVTPSATFGYDVASRATRIANANATISPTYFNDNLINTETTTYADNTARTLTYTYNADGNRATVAYPGPSPAPSFTYTYTGRNQLDHISDSSSVQWVKYLYDVSGNRQHRKLNNSVTDTQYGVADALNRIPSLSTTFTSGGTASFNYAFDVVSRLKYEQRNGGAADGYTYDLADQITGFNRAGTLNTQNGVVTGGAETMTLNFDANGNRISTVDNSVTKNYVTNALNEYTQDLNGTATNDVKGNLATTGDGWAYTYDAQNRLTHADKSATNTHVVYYYDGLNRQVARDENNLRTYSVWDGWSLIQEYGGSGNLLNNYLQGAGIDEIVARFGANYTNRIWYYQDARGNTSHVANDAGALVETYTYDLGGKPFITTATGKTSPNNRFLYSGRDYSSLTGLYDFRNRFYHPGTSRFLQSDPTSFAGGNHLYRYCSNNPANGRDPFGLEEGIVVLSNNIEPPQDAQRVIVTGDPVPPDGVTGPAPIGGPESPLGGASPGSGEPIRVEGPGFFFGKHVTQTSAPSAPFTPGLPAAAGGGSGGGNGSVLISYTGEISYQAGAFILSYGRFTGSVASNTTPAQSYTIAGRLDGVGIQIGYITGTAHVTFVATSPQGMLGTNGGFWTLSLGLAAGPVNALSGNLTINSYPTPGGPAAFGSIEPSLTVLEYSTDTTATDPRGYFRPKPGIGFSAAFFGITVQTVEPGP